MRMHQSRIALYRGRLVAASTAAVIMLVFLVLALPSHSQMITGEGRLVVPERRTLQWASGVGNRELLESTYARIRQLDGDEPGAWSYEWRQVASHFERQAQDAARRGDTAQARLAYLKASLYYAVGYFPDNATPVQQASYQQHLATYVAASRFFHHTLEVVQVPFEEAAIVVHLHLPADDTKPPLVVWNGGTDWWKASYHGLIEALVSRGVAVAAFDLPGTGESTPWTLGLDGGRLHRRVFDFLEQSGRFDFTRVGMIGVSFGGHYAVRVAASEPRVEAVVNFCGPIRRAFSTPPEVLVRLLASPEGGTIRAARRAAGLEQSRDTTVGQERFDLVKLGIVGEGRRIDVPLLTVNGTRDPLAPVEDLELVQRSAPKGELWLLGTAGHCAIEYSSIVWPQVFDWLEEQLHSGAQGLLIAVEAPAKTGGRLERTSPPDH